MNIDLSPTTWTRIASAALVGAFLTCREHPAEKAAAMRLLIDGAAGLLLGLEATAFVLRMILRRGIAYGEPYLAFMAHMETNPSHVIHVEIDNQAAYRKPGER